MRFVVLTLCLAVPASAQTRRPSRGAAPPASATKKEAPETTCPAPLGTGVTTKTLFCEVAIGRDPAGGILIKLPPHRGNVTVTFDLHARHTYSQEESHTYARYTASIGVLTMDNTLIKRAVVMAEYRSVKDLLDRIGGGAGPGGIKAVAPTGSEEVSITIPEAENQVSILGEKLTTERPEGPATYSTPGRPIAVISNVVLEFRPPAPPPPAKPAARKR